jgi:hypothetical protein
MSSNRSATRFAGGLLLALLALLVAARPATAAEPAVGGGSLAPGTGGTVPRLTREELLRGWDLDRNGSISKSEADIARARMRRTRLELQLGAGIDPLTGLPRGVDGAETSGDEPAEEPLFQLPPEPVPNEPSRTRTESLPGLRAPVSQAPSTAGPTLARPTAPAAPGSTPSPAATPKPLSARASWLPSQQLSPTATGGVRANAPAALPGYGSGAWSDLNAGRRPESLPSAAHGQGTGPTKPSGGLLPSIRPPGRTGAIILPPLPGRTVGPAAPRPPQAPVPRGPAPPRITADEIGADRP